jgi:hypothetical protein
MRVSTLTFVSSARVYYPQRVLVVAGLKFLIIKCSHTNNLAALEASIKLFTLFLKTTSKQPEVFSLLFLLAFWSRGLLTESDLAISTERSDSLTKTLRQNSL